jgi:hypothetical protein
MFQLNRNHDIVLRALENTLSGSSDIGRIDNIALMRILVMVELMEIEMILTPLLMVVG